MKEIFSLTAVVLTFVGYIPYFRDILKGKTHPHVYSWSLLTLLTILIVAQQIAGGAGIASWVTIVAGFMSLGVVFFSFKHGKKYITTSDTAVAILSLIAMGLWLVIHQPIISVILVVIADMLAFFPTVRKSWHAPYTETLSLYVTNTLRFTLALLAVEHYTILSSLWLTAWVTANGLFSVMIVVRRKAVPKRK